MAERDAALHAAGRLLAQLDDRQRADELAVVADALGRRALGRLDSVQVEERADLAHQAAASSELGREEAAAARPRRARRARACSRAGSPSRTRSGFQSSSSACGDGRAGALDVLGERAPGSRPRRRRRAPRARRAACCSGRANCAVVVEHVGDAAAHARGEVAAGRADHDDAAAGHVLAAVVADALDDGGGARVAHREPLAGDARGRTRAPTSRRRARCCRRSRSPRRGTPRRRAAARRARRRRGPCRRSRWRRRRASARSRARATRRTTARRCRELERAPSTARGRSS